MDILMRFYTSIAESSREILSSSLYFIFARQAGAGEMPATGGHPQGLKIRAPPVGNHAFSGQRTGRAARFAH
jgi:hypothetical protein